MVSLFSSLNIAKGALNVNESAISVVSHNVANMNTEGYSKQKVNLATRNIAGMIGDNVEAQVRANGGVMIENIMRYTDEYLNNYYRSQLSVLKDYEQQLGDLDDLADIFNDLDGEGIDAAISDLYKALDYLLEYPASASTRTNFVETAKTLVSVLNSKSVQLDKLVGLGDGESAEALDDSKITSLSVQFNNLLEELADVNKALQVTQTGTLEANNLLDKRDLILNNIAEYVDIRIKEHPNGSVNLYVGDVPVVKGATVTGKLELKTAKQYCIDNGLTYPDDWVDAEGNPKPAAVISIVGETTISYANDILKGGSIGGMLSSSELGGEGMNAGKARQALNNIAAALADMFNELNSRDGAYSIDHNNTRNLTPTWADNNIFVNADGTTSGITAANITVSSNLLTDTGIWDIACAYFTDVDDNYDVNAVGNSQNIVAMLNTRDKIHPLLDNMSLEDYYSAFLGRIATGGSNAKNLVETQGDIVDSILNQIKSSNTVDLNEELIDLVKYQTAYSAAAQVFNTVNSCLDTLISLGR